MEEEKQKLMRRDRAVSETVSTVLLVAIVVVLAAGFVVTGSDVFSPTEPVPEVSLSVSATGDPAAPNLTVRHEGGDTLSADELEIVGSYSGSLATEDGPYTAGDALVEGVTVSPDETIRVRHVADGRSFVLAEKTLSAVVVEAVSFNATFESDSPTSWNYYRNAVADGSVTVPETLQITPDEKDKEGAGLYTRAFAADDGLTVTFRYYAGPDASGADGLAFFLLDASQTSLGAFEPGPFGRALGYDTTRNGYDEPPDRPGIDGGYLGVGITSTQYHTDTGPASDEGLQIDEGVALRGAGDGTTDESAYPLLATNGTVPGGSVDGGWRRVRVTVDPDAGNVDEVGVEVEMSADGGQSWKTVIDVIPTASQVGSDVPETFYLGFSASTGKFTNTHAVDWVDVESTA